MTGTAVENVYLGIGSNLGDRRQFLMNAIRGIRQFPLTRVRSVSGIYETEPVGAENQENFLNSALWCESALEVHDFHRRIKELETGVGRKERIRWGPREIDIDILLWGEKIISDSALQIPHPELQNRRFVLRPLADIAAGAVHPQLGKTVRELEAECRDGHAVRYLSPLTDELLHQE